MLGGLGRAEKQGKYIHLHNLYTMKVTMWTPDIVAVPLPGM